MVLEGRETVSRKDRGYPTVHFKPTLTQRFAPALGFVAGMGTVELYFWLADRLFVPVALAGPLVGLLIATGANILIGSPGLVLTPWTAEVTKLRQRIVWWPDVREIRVERHQLMRTIVLYEHNGQRTRLRVPITGFLAWDRHFEEKYHTIGHWWLEHRVIQPQDAVPPLPQDKASTS